MDVFESIKRNHEEVFYLVSITVCHFSLGLHPVWKQRFSR